jgi:hypothetical protein
MKRTAAITLLAVLLSFLVKTELLAQSTTFSGYVRNHIGILMTDDYDYSILQDTFDLRIEHSRDKVAFKVNPYLDFRSNQDPTIDLRQSYMDIYFESVDVRIGKQQIIWGKADGVFITDIISPKDLREYLLPDFEEIRMGVQAVKTVYNFGDNTFEFVWLPTFTPTRLPEEDSIWYAAPDFPVTPVFDYSQKTVPENGKNSEVFARFTAMTSAVDFEIMMGYMWDDDPTIHQTRTIDPATGQVTLSVIPEHHRLGLGGGSFSSSLGGLVLRGEMAYYTGKYFTSEDPLLLDGVVEKNYVHYLLGTDYSLWDIQLSLQLIQQRILDYDELIVNDEAQDTVTLLIRRDFLRETLHLELFSYFGINDEDSLVRPKISYDLADGFNILLGANIFTGIEGNFGRYDDNDMLYTKIKYSF